MLMKSSVVGVSGAEAPTPGERHVPHIIGGWPAPQQIQGVPVFREQSLELTELPHRIGPRVSLFNGKDLDGFTPWLGYSNGTMFPTGPDDKPLGERGTGEVFKVAKEDGHEVIYISGRIWGAITTRKDYGNYHLSLWYKFGKQWGAEPSNTGVLYHSYGPYGAFSGTYMSSIEFEIKQSLTGMVATIGRGITANTELGLGPGPGLFGREDFRYMRGGALTEIRLPTVVKENRDIEHPVGQWNKVDLYVLGDGSVQVVNDVPCMVLSKIALTNAEGVRSPLVRGRIQLESEGTEVYMRDLWLEPIDRLPQIVAR
jgi:hypothetical protein